VVALRNNEADRFITSYKSGISVWLVFGSDPGLIDERIQSIVRKCCDDIHDAFQHIRLSSEQLSESAGRLAEEWNSIGLFNERRVIRLELGSKDIQDAVWQCLDDPNPDTTLVIRGGALKRDSSIRTLCERHKLAVAIECASDSAGDIKSLIKRDFTERQISIADDVLDHLVGVLGADRRTTRNELEKLTSYLGERQSVGIEDVEAVVADAAPRVGDVAVAAAMRGDISTLKLEAIRSVSTPSEFASLLMSCLRICLLVHRAWAEIEGGAQRSAAFEKAGRGMGPMRRMLQSVIEKSNPQSVLASIEILREAIGRTRREPALSEITSVRALWAVALRANRR
jgi:DNA polymerase-3 subunit delta